MSVSVPASPRNDRALGVLMPHSAAPAEVAKVARQAEALGYDSLWLPENCFLNGGVAAATIALSATSSLPVGLGVLPAPVRHPAVAAMELSTMALAYPGRLTAGFGYGVPSWITQVGLSARSPVQLVRRYAEIVRALLRGETVTTDEETPSGTACDAVRLAHPAGAVPIGIGAVGPRMLALAGAIADVVILSTLTGPRYAADAVGTIEAAANDAGRPRPKVVCFAAFHLGNDAARSRAAIRRDLAFSLRASGPGPLTDPIGASAELARLLADGGSDLADHVPDEWIDELAVASDIAGCARTIGALWDAGVDEVVLSPKPVDQATDLLSRAAHQLLPKLRSTNDDA